jgi:hypothetical protein
MSVFKFRAVIDEVEDLYRDIEILSTQTFRDFHEALVKYFEIKRKKPASFFISNEKWQKVKEISLGFEGTVDRSVDGNTEMLGKHLGKKAKRLIYINESSPNLTFLIELIDEHEDELKRKYPVCVKSVGSAALMSTVVDDLFADNMRIDEGEEGEDGEEGGSEFEESITSGDDEE